MIDMLNVGLALKHKQSRIAKVGEYPNLVLLSYCAFFYN